MADKALEVIGIRKAFNHNIVLDSVDFALEKGEVHAILGENGAGKSTLVKILAGMYPKDSGHIQVQGKDVAITSIDSAKQLGVNVVFQQHNLMKHFSVAENIFSDRIIQKNRLKNLFLLVRTQNIYKECQTLLDMLGFNISASTPVMNLNLAQKRMVEIAKAVFLQSKIIIMDEPTSAISSLEVETLFKQIKSLKEKGISIIYVSQKMEDIIRVADRVSVLRDGQMRGTITLSHFERKNLINMMSGEDFKNRYPKLFTLKERTVLQAEDVYTEHLSDINFRLHQGEILGFSGLVGGGKSELGKTIFGVSPLKNGRFFVNRKPVEIKSPRDAIRSGIAYIPDDREAYGLFGNMSVSANVMATHLVRSKDLLIGMKREEDMAREHLDKIEIKMNDIHDEVSILSGGNQQKVMLLKWLTTDANIFIFDEPTQGIDIATKVDIYNLMTDLMRKGASIILLSSDLNELLGMCDRVLVLFGGRIVKEVESKNTSYKELVEYTSEGGLS